MIDSQRFENFSVNAQSLLTLEELQTEIDKTHNSIRDLNIEETLYGSSVTGANPVKDAKLILEIIKVGSKLDENEAYLEYLDYLKFKYETLNYFLSTIRSYNYPEEENKLKRPTVATRYCAIISGKEEQGIKVFNKEKFNSILFSSFEEVEPIEISIRRLDQKLWVESYLQKLGEDELGRNYNESIKLAIDKTIEHLKSKNLIIIIHEFKEVEGIAEEAIMEFLDSLVLKLKSKGWNKSLNIVIYNDIDIHDDNPHISYSKLKKHVLSLDSSFNVGGFDELCEIDEKTFRSVITNGDLADTFVTLTGLDVGGVFLKKVIDQFQDYVRSVHPCHRFAKCIYKELAGIN